jgi:hypothetical protein
MRFQRRPTLADRSLAVYHDARLQEGASDAVASAQLVKGGLTKNGVASPSYEAFCKLSARWTDLFITPGPERRVKRVPTSVLLRLNRQMGINEFSRREDKRRDAPQSLRSTSICAYLEYEMPKNQKNTETQLQTPRVNPISKIFTNTCFIIPLYFIKFIHIFVVVTACKS